MTKEAEMKSLLCLSAKPPGTTWAGFLTVGFKPLSSAVPSQASVTTLLVGSRAGLWQKNKKTTEQSWHPEASCGMFW